MEFHESKFENDCITCVFVVFYQSINLLYACDFQVIDYLNFNFGCFFINGLCAWFLAALFVARNVYWFVLRFLKSEKYRFGLFVVLYALGYYLSHRIQNYWSFQQAFMFLFFLEYGQYLKRTGNCFLKFPLVSLLIYIVGYLYTFYVTDNSIIGIHNSISLTKATLVSNLIIAISASNLVLYVSRIVDQNRLLQYFGENSLIVYLLNWHVIVIAWDVLHPLLGTNVFVNVVCYLSVFLLTMSFSALLINILNLKYLRLAIGKSW